MAIAVLVVFSLHLLSIIALQHSRPPLLLISLDGFRHDYIELAKAHLGHDSLPNFDYLIKTGVRAKNSLNVYPTSTMPNHQTLVTGLYSESHGVVGNVVRDTELPHDLDMDSQTSLNNDLWLENWPEPLWVTLQNSGGRAGSVLWPLTDKQVNLSY
ncbi:unnamed protein product [Protopolystoma xenopodis]|uniref:Ectonucleotide pyrophosphatase/phosphodiesterase family member 6 n=1 Tax=Protopolystoma xenopodis TaxID=117903 RepID=A0A3S5AHK3_9PLAT|nr:unnamed protein product [Protopolystoma xenopodis]